MKIKSKIFICLFFSFVLSTDISIDFGNLTDILKKDKVLKSASLTLDRTDDFRAGEYISIKYTFDIEKDWYMYSIKEKFAPGTLMPDGSIFYSGHTVLEVFNEDDDVIDEEYFKVFENELLEGFDETVKPPKKSFYHKNNAVFVQNIKLLDNLKPGAYSFISSFSGQICKSVCIPLQNIETKITISIEKGNPRNRFILKGDETLFKDFTKSTIKPSDIPQTIDFKSVFNFIIAAFLAGCFALLTPCVFPMIPITVSFFTKQGEMNDNKNQVKLAGIYALSIVVIFSLLGLLLSTLLGATGAQQVGANPIVNLLIGMLFVFFAFSLFGYYEIDVPSFVKQYSLKQESRSGMVGIFFMALTFTLSAFTCTMPFVGAILAEAVTGAYFYPILGMVVFSSVLALPFFFLALFPQYLSSLPKSGGWLNSVKVIMGFLELAAALKFISSADLVWGWDIFTRKVVMIIWVIIFLMIAIYALGLIKFPHDSKILKLSRRRIITSIFFIIFTFWLSTGLFNRKIYSPNSVMKSTASFIDSWLPPYKDYRFIENYDLAVKKAIEKDMPLFIDFTGYACVNCRLMENEIFTEKEIDKIFNKFVLAKLYTDGGDAIHAEYADMLVDRFKTAALPYYAIIDPKTGSTIITFDGYDPDPDKFLKFLEEGLSEY